MGGVVLNYGWDEPAKFFEVTLLCYFLYGLATRVMYFLFHGFFAHYALDCCTCVRYAGCSLNDV